MKPTKQHPIWTMGMGNAGQEATKLLDYTVGYLSVHPQAMKDYEYFGVNLCSHQNLL